jgi:hypothetical protein
MPSLFRRKNSQSYLNNKHYVWLENTGDKDVKLTMASGNLRLDIGRKYRFQSDILELPQVKSLISDGQLTMTE